MWQLPPLIALALLAFMDGIALVGGANFARIQVRRVLRR
jgi:hypothetical protein